MEKSLQGEALSKRANYTESALPDQIFCANLLIVDMNSGILLRIAGAANGFAQ
jgi:hypothetical protein